MTCYNCDGCERYNIHISNLGGFNKPIKIGKIMFIKSIWLCKWCMTKAGIKYVMTNGFLEFVKSQKSEEKP